MKLSVIIPTFDPDLTRLRRVLDALEKQTLRREVWEVVVVDNGSKEPLRFGPHIPSWVRLVREEEAGLSPARRRGIRVAQGEVMILVDDDNVLQEDYLDLALKYMEKHPRLGVSGGKSLPEFETSHEEWKKEFYPLLALRDLGDERQEAAWEGEYPLCSPIGAGMVLRRPAAEAWLKSGHATLPDRCGGELSSSGDNDIVLCALKAEWKVAYDPTLVLTHLIPNTRLESDYLARLNFGIQKSWMRVLTLHGCNPWSPVAEWTVPLRCTKAWFVYGAWHSPAHRIRWRGACGHFEGRVQL